MANNGILSLVEGYRADPSGKFGGKDRLETLPWKFDKESIGEYADALKYLPDYGGKPLTPEDLTNMFLKEGRSDAGGASTFSDPSEKKYKDISNDLRKKGYSSKTSDFIATVISKQDAEKRTGVPFLKLWNGTGVNVYGQSGDDYLNSSRNSAYAATAVKNAPLLGYIKGVNSNKDISPQDNLLAHINRLESLGAIAGKDAFGELLDAKAKGTLKAPNPPSGIQNFNDAFQRYVHSKYREASGLPPTFGVSRPDEFNRLLANAWEGKEGPKRTLLAGANPFNDLGYSKSNTHDKSFSPETLEAVKKYAENPEVNNWIQQRVGNINPEQRKNIDKSKTENDGVLKKIIKSLSFQGGGRVRDI